MHDDSDEQVEEDGGGVLDAGTVEVEGVEGCCLRRHRHVVLQRYEDGGEGAGHLEHEAQHEDHGHARHNVRMVLDHKLVAETSKKM